MQESDKKIMADHMLTAKKDWEWPKIFFLKQICILCNENTFHILSFRAVA